MKEYQAAREWFDNLTWHEQQNVLGWLRQNPPPTGWTSTEIAYAFTEMPFAP